MRSYVLNTCTLKLCSFGTMLDYKNAAEMRTASCDTSPVCSLICLVHALASCACAPSASVRMVTGSIAHVNTQFAFDTGKKGYERIDKKLAMGGAMLIAARTHLSRRL